ncbi:hypothetical protein lerEdw1_017494 [Lerista edwardsae]|nr:hypothetical protein lerEdw1_017494 [Lerista edwardsae]
MAVVVDPVGCEHYCRGCLLKAPCCSKFYVCRLCHDSNEDHQMDRFKVQEVQCAKCEKVQQAQQNCENCNSVFGEYYCSICHLFDKDKKQYHCEKCGICSVLKMSQDKIVPYVWRTCYEDMLKEGYRCPLCMHSALDMTPYWRQLDDEVAQTPMPAEYQNMTVEILCSDCTSRSRVQFHILGMKCRNCDSYNTTQDGGCRVSRTSSD